MTAEQEKRAQARRLKLAREHANCPKATDGYVLVKRRTRADISEDTYFQHENGTRGMKRQVQNYAAAFDVAAEWLLWNRNPPEWAGGGEPERGAPRRIPVVSWVAAGKLADPDTQLPAEAESIEIGGLEPGDYFATRVRGDSMNRIAAEGATIIVNRADRELIRGRRYVFSRRGQTTFKRFGGSDPWRIEPESTNPENETIFAKPGETWEVIGRVRLAINEV